MAKEPAISTNGTNFTNAPGALLESIVGWIPHNTSTSYYYNIQWSLTGPIDFNPVVISTQDPSALDNPLGSSNPSFVVFGLGSISVGAYSLVSVCTVTTESGGQGTLVEGPYNPSPTQINVS